MSVRVHLHQLRVSCDLVASSGRTVAERARLQAWLRVALSILMREHRAGRVPL